MVGIISLRSSNNACLWAFAPSCLAFTTSKVRAGFAFYCTLPQSLWCFFCGCSIDSCLVDSTYNWSCLEESNFLACVAFQCNPPTQDVLSLSFLCLSEKFLLPPQNNSPLGAVFFTGRIPCLTLLQGGSWTKFLVFFFKLLLSPKFVMI